MRKFDEEADKFLSGTIIDKMIDEGFTGLQQSIGSIMKKTNKSGGNMMSSTTHVQRQGTTVTNGHSQQYQTQQNQVTGATLSKESGKPRINKQRSREKLQSQMTTKQCATNYSQGNKGPRDLEQQSRQDSEIDRTPFSVINKYMDHVSAALCFSGSLNNEYRPRDDELRESTTAW